MTKALTPSSTKRSIISSEYSRTRAIGSGPYGPRRYPRRNESTPQGVDHNRPSDREASETRIDTPMGALLVMAPSVRRAAATKGVLVSTLEVVQSRRLRDFP